MAYNVYFFKKTTSKKVVVIKLVTPSNRLNLLIKENPTFSKESEARAYYVLSWLKPHDFYKLGYSAISTNEYIQIRTQVFSILYSNDDLPF